MSATLRRGERGGEAKVFIEDSPPNLVGLRLAVFSPQLRSPSARRFERNGTVETGH